MLFFNYSDTEVPLSIQFLFLVLEGDMVKETESAVSYF